MQGLDRKRCGCAPANDSPLDLPAAFFVVRANASTELIPLHRIIDGEVVSEQVRVELSSL